MKLVHLLIVFLTIFVWIFSLPLMAVMTFFFFPVLLPFSFLSVLFSVYIINLEPRTHSFLRDFLASFQLYNWFPCNTMEIDTQSIVSVHPHGLLSCGALAGIHFVKGSETIFCVAPILYFVPFLGHSLNLLGCIPATRASMEGALFRKHSLIVVPGGVPELVLSETNNDSEFYPRFGFLKLAKEFQVSVFSVFINGETTTYNMIQLPFLRKRVQLSWIFNVPFMFPLLSGYCGTWLPKRVKLTLHKYLHGHDPTRSEYTHQLKMLTLEK
jgi:hypothetical protein